jgi:DNA polymerase V
MRTLESVVPEAEQYSIDEAFAPLAGSLAANADELALELRARVRKWTGIVVSVGTGSTRTLAKLASELAKRNNGVCRLDAGAYETERALGNTAAGEIWGIGRKSEEKLRLAGIRTARQLRDADDAMLRRLLSIAGVHTAMELRGIPRVNPADAPISRRTLISSRSFGRRVKDREHLAQALATHAALAGERLRRGNLEAGGVAVHIRTARHGQGPFYDRTVNIALPFPTASTPALVRATGKGLDAIFRPGYFYAKAGILLFDLSPPAIRQMSLWEKADDGARRDGKLMEALDAVNRKFGRGALRLGAEGNTDAPWRMQQNGRSHRWTTEWAELAVARA